MVKMSLHIFENVKQKDSLTLKTTNLKYIIRVTVLALAQAGSKDIISHLWSLLQICAELFVAQSAELTRLWRGIFYINNVYFGIHWFLD